MVGERRRIVSVWLVVVVISIVLAPATGRETSFWEGAVTVLWIARARVWAGRATTVVAHELLKRYDEMTVRYRR